MTNAVVRLAPAQRTTELLTKFVPLTVSVKAPSPAKRLVGEMLVVVGTGLGISVNVAVTDCGLLAAVAGVTVCL